MLVDTHCHINDVEAFPDPDSTIAEASDAGVKVLVVIGYDLETSRRAVAIAERHEHVYATVGFHPNNLAGYDKAGLDAIEQLLKHPKVVALGEVGLDYHWDYTTPEAQAGALAEQLDLARAADKPVVLHCREAYSALFDALEAFRGLRFVFHCFAGDDQDAERVKSFDGYFGIDGPVTYKKNDDYRRQIATLPKDRLLIETDCPWLPPHPYRGKQNKPAWLTLVNDVVAQCIGLPADECARVTTDNAKRFYGLK